MGKYRKELMIAVPALNEEERIEKTLLSIKCYGDVILFDNSSEDNTVKIAQDNSVNIVICKTKGYEFVLMTIIDKFLTSDYQLLLIIDGDGEVGLNSIDDALKKIETNQIDGVLGKRKYIKRLSEKIINLLFKYFFSIDDIYCGFKLIKKTGISDNISLNTFGTSIINKKGKYLNYEVDFNPRDGSRLNSFPFNGIRIFFYGLRGLIK